MQNKTYKTRHESIAERIPLIVYEIRITKLVCCLLQVGFNVYFKFLFKFDLFLVLEILRQNLFFLFSLYINYKGDPFKILIFGHFFERLQKTKSSFVFKLRI